MEPKNEDEVRCKLRKLVQEKGSLRTAAKELGISEPYLFNALYGKRSLGVRIPHYLGYELRYVEKEDE